MSAEAFLADDAWWARPGPEVLRALSTTNAGLSTAEARTRARPGIADSRPQTAPSLVIAQLRNPLVLILALSALTATLVRSYSDAAIILVILLLSALLGFVQEWRAAREVQDLLSRIRRTARVRRNGTEQVIPAAEVVPGDILILRAGDLVAADARVLAADTLFAIEAPLTGEPFPVVKTPDPVPHEAALSIRSSAVWTGTSIRSGTGEAVAVVTGRATVFGGIATSLERRESETAFTTGLRRFGLILSEVMLVIVLLVFAANTWLDRPFFDSLTFALALAVGLTPQMLPTMLSVTLASGARRLAQGGVIVRRLSSIENLGSMDVLCTDKTGTLTEGRVALARATDATGKDDARVLELAVLNARLQRGIDNALDSALLTEGDRLGLPEGQAEKLGEVPYDFSRRRLSVVVAEGDGALIVSKGAALSVLECCILSTKELKSLAARVEDWGREGFRVLGLASRRLPRRAEWSEADESDMRFEGFLLFSDPLRADARATVAALMGRGISVRIITGDNRFVAAHVAAGVGVPHARIVTETEIATLGADALSRLVARTHVFAEIDPAGKERLVAAFRQAGHVAGYIGDGINDATALRLADIGMSVEGAADVARDAADMILTSPDLGMVLKGVDEGRAAFTNTLKYLRITSAANFGNMVSMAAASVVLPFLPLTAGQILLNNLLSDIPMLALAGDRVDPEARHHPHHWQTGSLLRFMAVFGLLSSAFDLMTFWLLISVFHAPAELFHTAWFIESLLSELLFTLSIRTERPFWRSMPSSSLAVLSTAIAAVSIALSWSPVAFGIGFVPLPLQLGASLGLILLCYLCATELAKMASAAQWHTRGSAGKTKL